jgi:hypothetical protein
VDEEWKYPQNLPSLLSAPPHQSKAQARSAG